MSGGSVGSITYIDTMPEAALTVVPGQNVNDTGAIDTTVDFMDTGWSSPVIGQLQYAGSAERVTLRAHLHQSIPQTANRQRPAPVLELYKNGAVISTAASSYIRDASDHEEGSNTISWIDSQPGIDPIYEIRSRQEALAGEVNVITGQFSARAKPA